MKELKFTIGDESRPIIEKPDEQSNSLFSEVYSKANKLISEFAKDSLKLRKEKKRYKEGKSNIFAFMGERGSGKTSCMLSVEEMLKSNKDYQTLDLIDPSFFEAKTNILNVILAKLFAKFKDEVENSNSQCDRQGYMRESLIKNFQTVQENIKNIYQNKQSDDALDLLVANAASTELHSNIYELINSYLGFMMNDNVDQSFLVLTIDDIDLHTQYAYEMVEQIRKYFIHPNIIILLSVKIDQLDLVIKQHYYSEFKDLIEKNKEEFSIIREMSDKYLEKLIPLERRLYLPDANLYLENPLSIINGDAKPDNYSSIKEAVLSLIFRNTRFLFYNTKGRVSYIVPRNLRELRNLIKMLYNMFDDKSDGTHLEYNKKLFKKYFYETWVVTNLDKEGLAIIEAMTKASNSISINKIVVSKLYGKFSKFLDDKNIEVEAIVNPQNKSYNVSLGDVLLLIQHLEDSLSDDLSLKLLFSIKSIYSILLYEYYDEITESISEEEYNKVGIRLKAEGSKLFRQEAMENLSNYDKLVGGSFINYKTYDFIPKDKQLGNRSRRIINVESLKEIWNSYKGSPDMDQKHLRLLEFFALSIIGRKELLDIKNYKYRIENEIYYDVDLSSSHFEYYTFDITSVLYNIINIKDSYNRLFPGLSKFVDQCEDNYNESKKDGNNTNPTLFGRMLNVLNTRYENPENKRRYWLSWTSIRNIEVLDAWVQHRLNNRFKGGSDIEALASFFKKNGQLDSMVESTEKADIEETKEFLIRSYDKDKEDSCYEISFGFLNVLGEFLDEVSKDIELKNKFTAIYESMEMSFIKASEEMLDDEEEPFIINIKYPDKLGNLNETIKKRLILEPEYKILESELKKKLAEKLPNGQKTKVDDAIQIISDVISEIIEEKKLRTNG